MQDQVKQAVEILRAGEVIGFPTETVYGLAGSIRSEKALKKIFTLKERPLFDPLIVHIGRVEEAAQLVKEWPKSAACLAESFWPGPLTLVLPKSEAVHPLITAGLTTVALRMPNHPLALEILNELKEPLAAPSANKFGKTSPTTAGHVEKEFGPNLIVVDGGRSEVGIESTILSLTEVKNRIRIQILRPGMISLDEINTVLERAGFSIDILSASGGSPLLPSPGNFAEHYKPRRPLVILHESATKTVLERIRTSLQLPTGAIGLEIPLAAEPTIAARYLYSSMRGLSESADFLYIERSPKHLGAHWDAIWNRINRAGIRFEKNYSRIIEGVLTPSSGNSGFAEPGTSGTGMVGVSV